MVVRDKRKKYIINKNKFMRFIICSILFIMSMVWLVSTINDDIHDMVIKRHELPNVEIIDEDKIADIITVTTRAYALEDTVKLKTNYSIKPEGLDDIYFEWMIEISENEEIPLEVILAIITTENETYNANSIYWNSNGTADKGLCQVNSAYVDYFAKKYNIDNFDPYDVYDSMTFVARHMKYLSEYGINNYGLSERESYIFAAGAYNRGLSNECKYRNMYHYKEKFLSNYNKFI